MRILVAIASYGIQNVRFLHRLLTEYRSMPYEVDIVVLSDAPKDLGPNVEVKVGLPTSDPWSLPFGHKRIFADRLNDYDLFIYSEDDTLITEKNIRAYLHMCSVLPEDEVAGFLRFEEGNGGPANYCDVHGWYHWDPRSVRSRSGYVFAFFTNEHAACYLLTRKQLQRAIASGGFLREPSQGKYDLACTAATDPYTQCFKKMICISHLDDFLIHHLPNKYVGVLGIREPEFRKQVDALLDIGKGTRPNCQLLETETRLPSSKWSKSYYEPCRPEIRDLLPASVKSVLSVGCGWGAAESCLVENGMQVTGIPLDAVISACAEARGLEVAWGDLKTIQEKLNEQRFDCLVFSNVLHLVEDPAAFLSSFASYLVPGGKVISITPNLSRLPVCWKRFRSVEGFSDLGNYERTGVHVTSPRVVQEWFKRIGMRVEKTVDVVPHWLRVVSRLTFGLSNPLLASELITVAGRGETVGF